MMTDRSSTQPQAGAAVRRSASSRRALIPTTPLLVTSAFGAGLPAPDVGAAIARGLRAGGLPAADVCPIDPAHAHGPEARAFLDANDFDARMRRARAVVVVAEQLREQMLTGSATFEVATRARQAGVPAYAVTGENLLDRFGARMLDLQLIVEASGAPALAAAGRKLAPLLRP
jgi:hypothetical protein